MTNDDGQVVAVCLSAQGGVPKYSQQAIAIGPQGVEGDYHAGPVNRHKKTDEPEPNWRHVTVVAQEVLDQMTTRLGIELKPGDLSENVLVAGVGDLSEFQRGDRLMLGSDVVLKVTAQNRPCDVIRVYHPMLVEEITGRRGVTAVVVRTGTVRPGDGARIAVAPSDSLQDSS